MAISNGPRWFIVILLFVVANAADIFLEWHVAINNTIKPASSEQPVITVNGMFPGPLINATTNDNIYVNVFNEIDEPLLMTWNGIQQRLNSWQDGVSGTNCPIPPGTNWTYVFQTKDQIGTFFYFPSINFLKAGGGFGPFRVNNRVVILVPFAKPEAEFDLLIGDWYATSYKDIRSSMNKTSGYSGLPDKMLMNGKGPYSDPKLAHESFTATQGKTYRFRVANVGNVLSFNFRIQNHRMVIVETEGSYTNQITVDSLDIHLGQSYSVLVTADQNPSDYYIVASPKMLDASNSTNLVGVGVLHYDNSSTSPSGPLPSGPDPFDLSFSITQARSIRWNMTTGAARPNPQGTFNVTNVTLSQTFILHGSMAEIGGLPCYTVNNISYITPDTPLKVADQLANGTGVYLLDQYPSNVSQATPVNATYVVSGIHKGWLEIVLKNDLDVMDSWHLDGFGFYVVGFGDGEWTPDSRLSYNLNDPVVRSTTQVYPGGWTAVYAYLDNPGMWNLRSQNLKHWYLGQELYIRVYDPDPNPAKERPPPDNQLLCGNFAPSNPPSSAPPPSGPNPPSNPPSSAPPPSGPEPYPTPAGPTASSAPAFAPWRLNSWFTLVLICIAMLVV